MNIVLLYLPDGRWIGLSPEMLAQALTVGAEVMPIKAHPASGEGHHGQQWLSAGEMGKKLGFTASWLLQRSRLGLMPHKKIGKFVRFNAAAVEQYLAENPDQRSQSPNTGRKRLIERNK